MRHHPVGERSLGGARRQRGADDRGCSFAKARSRVAQRRLARSELRTGNHGGKCVEKVVLRAFLDLRRQGGAGRTAHIGAERSHLRTDRSLLIGCTDGGEALDPCKREKRKPRHSLLRVFIAPSDFPH
jgi:hypothetical protein